MAYEEVKQIVAEFETAKTTFEERMKGTFAQIFKTFFEHYPEIKAVGWTQYTPYFNDGEECIFNVHDFWFIDENGIDEAEGGARGYELEELSLKSAYSQKPSAYTYKYRDEYPEYDEQIKRYEDAVANNPRYYEVTKGIDELDSLLRSIPDEIFQSSFGDHVSVLAKADGIEVEEYEHD
jgi:hypothetical protein